jgi:Zn-dependent metalloprotease
MRRALVACAALAAGTLVAGTVAGVNLASADPGPSAPSLAASSAKTLVAGHPANLHASSHDEFTQHKVISGQGGMQFVPYTRTYKDLPVVGGDFVVVTDSSGHVTYTSVAQTKAIGELGTTPKLSADRAESIAKGQLENVSNVSDAVLSVYALGASGARLAWTTRVTGEDRDGDFSRQAVYVDALTGKILAHREEITYGNGTAAYSGPNPVQLGTTQSGSTYLMQDPGNSTIRCQDAATNTTFSGPDDNWGNGDASVRETGCVDGLFGVQTENKMLSQWLGRNGMNGSGGWVPLRVGLNQVNAYYDGTQVQIGHNQDTPAKWISSIDVVAHEYGHGIDDTTPGGISGAGTQEFIADVFGATTEWYANEPSPYDTPDFLVGEEVNLVGQGPIRNMYNPGALGDPNCYSSSIPTTEVHAAAGPGNHWFYLLAMGTNPTNGQPTSTTCNGATNLAGIGVQAAAKILYQAMLMKTTASSYLKYRTWTLTAAKNLDATCGYFNKVKAAWDAVSVPAQTGDPTCGATTPPPGGCSGQQLANPGFESGATSWTASSGVIGQWGTQGEPTHSGTWNAWLDGYGTTHTDTLSQSVTIPAGCRATLTFWLHIDTAETTTTVAYDKLTVTVGSTTVATYSNLNKSTGYVQKTIDVSSFAGQTVTLKFTGVEDSSLQTSFVIDDTALTLG